MGKINILSIEEVIKITPENIGYFSIEVKNSRARNNEIIRAMFKYHRERNPQEKCMTIYLAIAEQTGKSVRTVETIISEEK